MSADPAPLTVKPHRVVPLLLTRKQAARISCGHCFCRGCWTHVLQGRAARATAHHTGTAACPYRCEVKPLVPEIDQTLASQLESQFAEEYKKRASATSLPDEERRSTSFNECTLDAREVAKQAEEAATAQAATVQARTESRLRNMIIDVSVVGAVLLFALLVLLLMTAAHPTFASTHPG